MLSDSSFKLLGLRQLTLFPPMVVCVYTYDHVHVCLEFLNKIVSVLTPKICKPQA